MTDDRGADPHSEYRRQAALHFGRPEAAQPPDVPEPYRPPQMEAAKPPTMPRIFRPGESTTEQIAATPDEEATRAVPAPAANAAAALAESTQRFGAGTVYGADGTGQGASRPAVNAAVSRADDVQSIYKVTPREQTPPPRTRPPLTPPRPLTPPAFVPERGPAQSFAPSPVADNGASVLAAGIPNVNFYAALTMILAVIFPPLAIPLGHVARTHVVAGGEPGEQLVRTGLVLAYVSSVIFMCLLVVSGVAAMI